MSLETELGLSPKLTAISFLDGRFAPGGTGVDSTLLISSIHFRIVSTLKFPIDSFCSGYSLHGLLSAFEVSLCRLTADKARPQQTANAKMKPQPQGRMGKIDGGCLKACQKESCFK